MEALKGIKVLDFSQLLAGPYAAMMLGDMGAEIIKIERCETGDSYRQMTFSNCFLDDNLSSVFAAWNRNKKSIAMDLKYEEIKEIVYSMVKTADIVIHNFRPGVMERLGFGYQKFKSINPKIIYGSNSGFGETGPYVDRPGQDLLAQGLSGIMSLTGRKGSPPSSIGTGLADHLSAYHLVYGILSALYYREQTGVGQKVDVNLFGSMLAFMNQELTTLLNFDIQVEKPDSGIALPFQEAPYGVYACSDGYISIAMNDFEKLILVLDLLDLKVYDTAKKRYEQRDEIYQKIAKVTKQRKTEEWLQLLLKEDLWVAKVNDINDVIHDPQVAQMGIIQELSVSDTKTVKTVGSPVTMSETQPKISRGVPSVGKDTREVLKSIGMDDNEINILVEKKLIYEQ